MIIKLDIKGLDKTVAHIAGIGKQLRYATAVALTRTARKVADAMPAALEQGLDRPTTFTKKGLFVTRADKENLTAVVGFKDRQAGYMKYQIAGGTRTPGPRGIKLPGNIQLNAFGNIPRGMIDKLKAAAKDGSLGRGVAKSLGANNRRKGAAPIQLFYGKPTGRGWEKAPMGIWRRIPGNPGKLVPVIVFEDSPAKYKPRFDFQRRAIEVVEREWNKQFAAAFDQAMRSAK